jgi:excisionase family DNA binding protein
MTPAELPHLDPGADPVSGGPWDGGPGRVVCDVSTLPYLLTAAEAAALLRTTPKAIYARAERGLLPGLVRDGRRILVRRDELLRYLSERRATSPEGHRR